MSRRLALNLARLKVRRRQRDVDKCDVNFEAKVEMRLGGIEEEVEDTINVFEDLLEYLRLLIGARS